MDINEIVNLAIAALGGGGVTSLVNWRLHKRKEAASVKEDESEVIRKTVDEVYKPTIESLKGEVTELREEVTKLRSDIKVLRNERDECHEALAAIQNRVDGLAAGRPQRNPRTGRYTRGEAKDGNDKP